MDAIKQAVSQSLEKQGVLAQLKAHLRAQVFLAVEEYEQGSSGVGLASKSSNATRDALLRDPDGDLVLQLVLDLLDSCNFAFTRMVFQPESGKQTSLDRRGTASKLGIDADSGTPLLLNLVKSCRGGTINTSRKVSGGGSAPSATKPEAPSATPSQLPPAPVPSKPALAPLEPVSAGRNLPPPVATSKPASQPVQQKSAETKPPLDHQRSDKSLDRQKSDRSLDRQDSDKGLRRQSSGGGGRLSSGGGAPAKPAQPVVHEDEEEEEYEDDLEAPDPEDLVDEDVEVVDDDVADEAEANDNDDEDYATAMGYKSPPAASSSAKASGASRGGMPEQNELELSNSSDRAYAAPGGRLRPLRSGGNALNRSGDSDIMAGDRSFGVSHELAGLDVGGNSGGLSFSNDFAGGFPGDKTSLSGSAALLSPISEGPKLGSKLEPLRPLGASKLSPLAPLAPLSGSLTASSEIPLTKTGPSPLAPLGSRKSVPDIDKEREELRRLGLLQSGDSLGASGLDEGRTSSGGGLPPATRPRGQIYDAEFSVSASLDMQDDAPSSEGFGRLPGKGFGSKGRSMDMTGLTGLSASDRSGDIDAFGADLAETAEWH